MDFPTRQYQVCPLLLRVKQLNLKNTLIHNVKKKNVTGKSYQNLRF